MKITLSIYEVADRLLNDEFSNWTHDESLALAEYYEQLEEDCGIEIELDVVAIRCEWVSFSTLQEVRDNYTDCPEGELDALEWLYDRAQVIILEDGSLLVTEF
tara:strand:- start:413 stop:721 length:309 start_codon:yes stop_codon:yes gene_type:complete